MEFTKEELEEMIVPVSLKNPVKGFIGYKLEKITEGWLMDHVFFCNTPGACIFDGFFSWNRRSCSGFGVYVEKDIGEYEILPKKKVELIVRKPNSLERCNYFVIPYDEKRGYNRYEKEGGKENVIIRLLSDKG